MPKGVTDFITGKSLAGQAGGAVADAFSPDLPEVERQDPASKRAVLPSVQAQERALMNRAGLQTTKKVGYSLLRQSGRSTLGGASV